MRANVGQMAAHNLELSDKPRFIDQLAVDFVVREHRYMNLTPGERRHAAHRLVLQAGVTHLRISEILRCTPRTVERLLSVPPPPMLDVNEDGQRFLVAS